MLLRNAGGDTIKVYCILDRDYRPPGEIESRRQEAQERGVQLHVWNRKEIENYLLVPSAIARLVRELRGRNSDQPSQEEVADCLSRLADGLRDETLDAIATEIYLQDKGAGIARANRQARERVSDAWQSLEGELSIVPGKRMLSDLSAWSQSQFGVSISIARLAAIFLERELSPEVVSVVTAIERGANFDAGSE